MPAKDSHRNVALVCDWLTTPGGAEKVLLELHQMYPDAPIYTSQYNPKGIDWFQDATVKTGWLQIFPSFLRKFLGPLRQIYFSHLDLSDYDLVISVTGAEAKSVRTTPKTRRLSRKEKKNILSSETALFDDKTSWSLEVGHLSPRKGSIHLCYCHVPTQYYWQMYDKYAENPGFGFLNPLVRGFFKLLVKPLRRADYRAAQQPDQFITISEYAADQIKRYYDRDAVIIAPPVEVAKFAARAKTKTEAAQVASSVFPQYLYEPHRPGQTPTIICQSPPNYYIIACRQVTWKRVDLAIEACLAAKVPLLVVGDGPEHARLVKLAQGSPLIKFLPWTPTAELATYLRGAKAYLFPSLEPFGIAAVEALAAGCPVIAYQEGGSRDFVTPGQNGLLFADQTVDSLKSAILEFEQRKKPFDRAKVAKTAQKFAPSRFDRAIRTLIAKFQPTKSSGKPCGKLPQKSTASLSINPIQAPSSKNPLVKALLAWFYLLPVVIFCSYYPLISLGASSSMNFELSLPLIWLVIFDILSFAALIIMRSHNGLSDRKFFLLSLFPFWATLSIFWSPNPVRAVLTAGIIWLLFFAIFSIVAILPHFLQKRQKSRLITVFLAASVAVSAFCWLQAILDTVGFSRANTLLCAGCTYRSFGFPHPSGLAIEPQFMGNLLLAPALLCLFMLAWRRNQLFRRRLWLILAASLIIISTLFFTFSRGAIYAFAVALVILLIFALAEHRFRWSLLAIPALACLLSFTAQGTFAALGPTSETFTSAIAKSIHHLSLGLIDLRSLVPATSETTAVSDNSSTSGLPVSASTGVANEPYFDGYVAESTNVRLDLNAAALQTWLAAPGPGLKTARFGHDCPPEPAPFSDNCASYVVIRYNPRSILFGVGLGGAGTALYENRAITHATSPKEIVQNQPLSLLFELGLVGVSLLIFELLLVFCPQIFPSKFVDGRAATSQCPQSDFWRHPALPLLLSLIAAYVITLQFFSGLPNALQIYLMPPFIYLIFLQKSPKSA